MLPWKLRKRHVLTVNQNLSSLYFSFAKFQFVSCNLSFVMIWQMTYTQKLPKLCSATFLGAYTTTTPMATKTSLKKGIGAVLTLSHLFHASLSIRHIMANFKK